MIKEAILRSIITCPNMNVKLIVISLFILASCQPAANEEVTKKKSKTGEVSFFVGTYTAKKSQGIYKYALHKDGRLKQIGLAAISNNPSFLSMSDDRQFLVAVNEVNQEGTGTVESFLIEGDSLQLISRSNSGGAHPCFVAINEAGYILTANYTGGNVGLLKINNKGELSDLLDIQQHSGKGSTKRQEAPHAHSAWFVPNSDDIISVDLGTNELWLSTLDKEQQIIQTSDPQKVLMPIGAGPRHLVFHPNGQWIYVLNELTCQVQQVLKAANGEYYLGQSKSTLPKDYMEENTCADIHISADGNFLYASNRGHNSIAIYSINTVSGVLKILGHESTRGDGPRNFALSPDGQYLLVANQHTNNIVSFKRDKDSGLLTFVEEVKALTPVCILF